MASYDGSSGYGQRVSTIDEGLVGEISGFQNGQFTHPSVGTSQSPLMTATGPFVAGQNVNLRPEMNSVSNGHSTANSGTTVPSNHHNNTPVPVSRNGLVQANMQPRFSQQQFLQQQQQMAHQKLPFPQKQGLENGTQNGLQNGPSNGTANGGQTPVLAHPGTAKTQPLVANAFVDPNLRRNSAAPVPAAVNAQQELINARNIRRSLGSAAIMRILDLVELVSSAPQEIIATLAFWTRACEAFFRPSSIMRFTGPVDSDDNNSSPAAIFQDASLADNLYQLNMSAAPRFFLAQVLAHSVVKHDIYLTGFRYQVLTSGLIILVCRINLDFNYADGSTGTAAGMCHFLMTRDLYVQQLDCRIDRFQQSLSMAAIQQQWAMFQAQDQDHDEDEDEDDENADFYHRVQQSAECSKLSRNTGLSHSAMRLMQIGDVMSCLQPLIQYTQTSQIVSPLQALEKFVEEGSKPPARRTSLASMASMASQAPATSPSPKTMAMAMDERKPKARRASTALNSPMPPDHRRV